MENNLTISDEGAYDKENPKSLYNLLPPSQQEHLLRVKNCFLRDLSEYSTKKEIKHMSEYPLVRKLRQSFWMEYNNALGAGRKMHMTRIWQGLTINGSEFYNLMKQDHFAAFVFTKPINRETQERSLLELAYEEMESIMLTSHLNKDGSLNAYAAKIKFDMWKHLDERVNGGVVKQIAMKSEQKTYNVNVDASAQQMVEMRKAEEMGARLAELRERTKDIEAIAHVVEEDHDSH